MLIENIARKYFIDCSHGQAVAAKAARQKDRQQNYGSKTRSDALNYNQVDSFVHYVILRNSI